MKHTRPKSFNFEKIHKTFFSNKRYHCTACILRSFILDNHLQYKEDLHYGEDLLFFELLLAFSDIKVNLNYCVYLYRNRPGSAMHTINDEVYLNNLYLRIEYYEHYIRIASQDKVKFFLKERKNEVVRNILFHNILTKEKPLQSLVTSLKEKGVYPYPLIWSDIFVYHNFKDALIKYFCFFLPFETYLFFIDRICSILRK